MFWDESANTWKFLTVGTGLNITATTLTSTGLSNPMTAIGDMIYGDTAGAVARLAGNTTTTKKFLTSVGDGTNSTAPAWSLDFSTDGTFAGNSDTIIPSQKAIKTYVDGKVNLDQSTQQTILNDSPLFSEGVEMSNEKWLRSKDYAESDGAGGADSFAVKLLNSAGLDITETAATTDTDKFLVSDSGRVKYRTGAEVLSDIGAQAALGYTAENSANKVTSFQSTPDDTHYASEKLVKDSLNAKAPLASPSFTGTVTLPKAVNIKDTSADHEYQLGVSELAANRTVTLPLLTGNDTFMFKDFHKASSAEINTGTEDNKYITPDALAGSNAFTKTVQQYCVEWGTELAVKDGVGYIEIPAECNGMNLISARARVGTAGTTNASTFDIYNVTDSTSMLSSAISIASGAKSGTGTVDTAHDDVATGDLIRIDVDTLSTTKPKGLIVTLAFRLP